MENIQIDTRTATFNFTGSVSSFTYYISLRKDAYKLIVKRVRYDADGVVDDTTDTTPKIIKSTIKNNSDILVDFSPNDYSELNYVHNDGPYRSGTYTFSMCNNDGSPLTPAATAKIAITLEFHEYIK